MRDIRERAVRRRAAASGALPEATTPPSNRLPRCPEYGMGESKTNIAIVYVNIENSRGRVVQRVPTTVRFEGSITYSEIMSRALDNAAAALAGNSTGGDSPPTQGRGRKPTATGSLIGELCRG